MDIKNLSNDELISKIDVICQNHEKCKQELLILHELLNDLENQYIELGTELKNRK